jgi:integrase
MKKQNKRAPNGEASIVVRSNRLRLLIPKSVHPEGRRAEIALDMANSEAGQTVAAQILADLKLDIYNGKFDESLAKYQRKPMTKVMTIYELWCEYVNYRRATIKLSTLHYYEEIIGHRLRDCPQSITKELDVRRWLLENMSQAYAARVLGSLSWAVTWGMKHKLIEIEQNLYIEMAKQTKPKDTTPPADAFNTEEKEQILNSFLTSHRYDHYYPFVYFLFITGCRPSEAIGLQWVDISDDLKLINFTGSITQIKSKAVRMEKSKNNRVRSFPINTELRDLLEACGHSTGRPYELVFPSAEDPEIPINYQNFSKSAWEKTVDPIVGRSTTPYSCRDTFITEQIAKGIPVAIVARWVDNSPLIIDKRYFDISAVSFTPK